jgi:hypothetical protein
MDFDTLVREFVAPTALSASLLIKQFHQDVERWSNSPGGESVVAFLNQHKLFRWIIKDGKIAFDVEGPSPKKPRIDPSVLTNVVDTYISRNMFFRTHFPVRFATYTKVLNAQTLDMRYNPNAPVRDYVDKRKSVADTFTWMNDEAKWSEAYRKIHPDGSPQDGDEEKLKHFVVVRTMAYLYYVSIYQQFDIHILEKYWKEYSYTDRGEEDPRSPQSRLQSPPRVRRNAPRTDFSEKRGGFSEKHPGFSERRGTPNDSKPGTGTPYVGSRPVPFGMTPNQREGEDERSIRKRLDGVRRRLIEDDDSENQTFGDDDDDDNNNNTDDDDETQNFDGVDTTTDTRHYRDHDRIHRNRHPRDRKKASGEQNEENPSDTSTHLSMYEQIRINNFANAVIKFQKRRTKLAREYSQNLGELNYVEQIWLGDQTTAMRRDKVQLLIDFSSIISDIIVPHNLQRLMISIKELMNVVFPNTVTEMNTLEDMSDQLSGLSLADRRVGRERYIQRSVRGYHRLP